MDEHHDEDVFDTLQEGVDISGEREDHHDEEKEDGNPLERLFQRLGDFGQELRAEDAEGERDAQQDEDGLEDIPQGDDQRRDLARDFRSMEIKVAPDIKVGRGHQDGERRADRGQGNGQLDIGLGQGGHEVGDVASRAGGHQDHAETHHRRDPGTHQPGQAESEGRQQDQLAEHAEQDGLGFLENFDEDAGLDAQGNAEHDESKHDVDRVHAAGVEGHIDLVDMGGDFRTHSLQYYRL